MQLKPQLFVLRNIKDDYCPSKIKPAYNGWVKPERAGGLWTSTFDIETKNQWVEFRTRESFEVPLDGKWRGYILTPKKKARIYVIDSLSDLLRLLDKYPYNPYKENSFIRWGVTIYPDFEAISKDYDAIHLTQEGQWATRMTEPNLYGWDFESTLWFRDCFTHATPVSFKTEKGVKQEPWNFKAMIEEADKNLTELLNVEFADDREHLRARLANVLNQVSEQKQGELVLSM